MSTENPIKTKSESTETDSTYLDLVGEDTQENRPSETHSESAQAEHSPTSSSTAEQDISSITSVRERLTEHTKSEVAERVSVPNIEATSKEQESNQREQELKFLDSLSMENGDTEWGLDSKDNIRRGIENGANPRILLASSLTSEAMKNESTRKTVTKVFVGGGAVGVFVLMGGALLAVPPVAIGGLILGGAGLVGAGVARMGMKAFHALKQRRHQKAYEKLFGFQAPKHVTVSPEDARLAA